MNKKNNQSIFICLLFACCNITASLSDNGYESDASFKSIICNNVAATRLDPTCYTTAKSNKRKRQEQDDISINQMETWERYIFEGSNKQLENYLQQLPKDSVPVNKRGQNPAHIAAKKPGGEYSLFMVGRNRPAFFNLKDAKGRLPKDYIPSQTNKQTAKWRTVRNVETAIAISRK